MSSGSDKTWVQVQGKTWVQVLGKTRVQIRARLGFRFGQDLGSGSGKFRFNARQDLGSGPGKTWGQVRARLEFCYKQDRFRFMQFLGSG